MKCSLKKRKIEKKWKKKKLLTNQKSRGYISQSQVIISTKSEKLFIGRNKKKNGPTTNHLYAKPGLLDFGFLQILQELFLSLFRVTTTQAKHLQHVFCFKFTDMHTLFVEVNRHSHFSTSGSSTRCSFACQIILFHQIPQQHTLKESA